MADDSERWTQVERQSRTRERFQAKASPIVLHHDPSRRRNADQEEAARDRLIFRWVVLVLGLAGLLGLLLFVTKRLGK